MSLTERAIQRGLMNHFGSSFQCACPNFTPSKWWECDLWAVTKAGYVVEYEIKMSVGDFAADRHKARNGYCYETLTPIHRNKHELLAAGDCVPSRFFFVVPHDLSETIRPRLPAFAGLVKVKGSGRWCECHIVVPAPKLHRNQVADGEIAHAMKATYYRYWKAIQTIEDLHSQAALLGEGGKP